jgi:chemotaxis protein methyltransferase WspC
VNPEPFETLLSERIGLNPSSIGRDEVERAVAARMRLVSVTDPASYLALCLADDEELDELIERVLVPETWFFREPAAFETLRERAAPVVAEGRKRQRFFRVLSIPCSTGEEAYSIAMTLVEAGLSVATARVDALDLSPRALEAARLKRYHARALRYVDSLRRDRHFVKRPMDNEPAHPVDAESWEVDDDVARLVTFRRANLVDPALLAGSAPYDVVFCRNVLMYFGRRARTQVLQTMFRLVKDDGLLITGHAEGYAIVAPWFRSAGIKGVFAFRKSGPSSSATHPKGSDRRDDAARGQARRATDHAPPPTLSGQVRRRDEASAGKVRAARPSVDAPRGRPASGLLAEVARLADSGRLGDARIRCAELLADKPDLAEGHFLSGVIALASGERHEAELAFRHAIYLDPRHEQALLHLALERDREGDAKEAEQLRRRARMVKK